MLISIIFTLNMYYNSIIDVTHVLRHTVVFNSLFAGTSQDEVIAITGH